MARRRSASRNVGGAPSALARQLHRLALDLPPPHRHDIGMPLPRPDLPRGVRFFSRRDTHFMSEPPHANADAFVLLISLQGTADVMLDDVTLSVHPGDAVLFFPGQVHRYIHPRPPLLWLFSSFQLAQPHEWLPLKYTVTPLGPPLWRHLVGVLQAYRDPRGTEASVRAGLAVDFWRLLLGLLDAQAATPSPQVVRRDIPAPHHQAIQRAQQVMLATLGEALTVRQLATQLGMSVSTLQELYRKYQPYGVGEAMRRLRVNSAARMIIASEEPLKKIAEKCGFSSQYVFSRTFKKITGYAPQHYRRVLQRIHDS